MLKRFEFQIDQSFHRKRVDQFLFDKFNSLSKMYLRDVIKAEKCEVNGFTVNSGKVLKHNDFLEIELDVSRETAMRAQEIPLDIIFEDDHLLVVNKAAGILVHPTHREKNGTLLNGLAFYLRQNGGNFETVRPGLIHRLDKQTSGLMVISKTERALRLLTGKFRRKMVKKRYLALVEGTISKGCGEIIAPVGRFAEEKIWNVKEDGKYAESRFEVIERRSDSTLIELEPVTGRTNQLRIHCAYIGNPIIGDVKYGSRDFYRLCLHASELEFEHPETRELLQFRSPVDFLIGQI